MPRPFCHTPRPHHSISTAADAAATLFQNPARRTKERANNRWWRKSWAIISRARIQVNNRSQIRKSLCVRRLCGYSSSTLDCFRPLQMSLEQIMFNCINAPRAGPMFKTQRVLLTHFTVKSNLWINLISFETS